MIVIAHISDIHIGGGERSVERTERVMTYVNDLRRPVDIVLVTGDIADHGRIAEYDRARALLTSELPVLTCPGNHDDRSAFRTALLDGVGGDGPINLVYDVAGVRIAMCDSTIPGRDDGYLSDETIEWLEAALTDRTDGRPALIAFHHPPVRLYSPFIDEIRQRGERRLAQVVERHPEVVAVLCGHAHTAAASTFAGRPLLVAPGVVSTLRLPWENGDPLDYDLPPAIALHMIDDDRRITTHYRVVPAVVDDH
ncbi:MAG: phosphodiesterase [Jiangellaceae bacterium]